MSKIPNEVDPFMRVMRINKPLVECGALSPDRPLRECIPGIWPTFGEFVDFMQFVSAILSERARHEAEKAEMAKENAGLREALKPFADAGDYLTEETEGFQDTDQIELCVTDENGKTHELFAELMFGQFRRARIALEE